MSGIWFLVSIYIIFVTEIVYFLFCACLWCTQCTWSAQWEIRIGAEKAGTHFTPSAAFCSLTGELILSSYIITRTTKGIIDSLQMYQSLFALCIPSSLFKFSAAWNILPVSLAPPITWHLPLPFSHWVAWGSLLLSLKTLGLFLSSAN